MPVKCVKIGKGGYCQWGSSGKKYRYKSSKGKASARRKAHKQARAIYASGYKG